MNKDERAISVHHHILKDQMDYVDGVLRVIKRQLLSKKEREELSKAQKSIGLIKISLGDFINNRRMDK